MVDWLEPAPTLDGIVWVLLLDSGAAPEMNPEDTSVRCAVFPQGVFGTGTHGSSAEADKGATIGTESGTEP